MAEITIGESAAGRIMTVACGDQVMVELPENPTTGFRWQLVSVDSNVLRLQTDGSQPGTGQGIGGGGMHVFRFAAIARGSTDIRLELSRSWEETQAPRSTFGVSVQVT